MRRIFGSGKTQPPDAHSLVERLRSEGIRSDSVLDAIAAVPRDRFIPERSQDASWANSALPIGHGQTISQPYVVAVMTEALELDGHEHVLEIGTGSGYQAAILSQLVTSVVSIERIPELADEARRRLSSLGIDNVTIVVGDGSAGYAPSAPYDAIIVTAGSPSVPPSLVEQLAPNGGTMVLPVGDANGQELVAIVRTGSSTTTRNLGPVAFVPLIGANAWPEPVTRKQNPGEEQKMSSINPDVRIGHVHLKVSNLERSIAFYHEAFGFDVVERMADSAAFLSAGGYHHHIGLNTWESRDGSPPPTGSTGLYHFALLYPTRLDLARAYQRLIANGIRIDGAADHGVSQAIYLHDPDQNGIEIYWDRVRNEWPRKPDGSLRMITARLDLQALLDELAATKVTEQ